MRREVQGLGRAVLTYLYVAVQSPCRNRELVRSGLLQIWQTRAPTNRLEDRSMRKDFTGIAVLAFLVIGAALLRWDLRWFLYFSFFLAVLWWYSHLARWRVLANSLDSLDDGGLEIEARVRRLESYLLKEDRLKETAREQKERVFVPKSDPPWWGDPLDFLDAKTGTRRLTDKSTAHLKSLIREVRLHERLRRVDPKAALQIEKLEALDVSSSTEEDISEAFRD